MVFPLTEYDLRFMETDGSSIIYVLAFEEECSKFNYFGLGSSKSRLEGRLGSRI